MQINVGTIPGQVAEAVIEVDANGNPIQDVLTYAIAIADYTPPALATDVLQIIGSATKTICITSVRVSAHANSAGSIDVYGYKRTTLNTGGTVSNPTPVKYDSLNPTQTATINLYSAKPSALGTGTVASGIQYIVPASSGSAGIPIIPATFQYGTETTQAITLRGVNESYCVSLNGQTIPAGLGMYITVEWTEQ